MCNANWPVAINIQLHFSKIKMSSIFSKEKYIKLHCSTISITELSQKKNTNILIGI